MADVIMPKMSDAMTEGRVLSWRKRTGEAVHRGEPIAEIETDKVNVEIEAEADGTLGEIVAPEGATVPVGSVIARINGGRGAGARAPEPAQARPDKGGPRAEPPRPSQDTSGIPPAPTAPQPAPPAPPAPQPSERGRVDARPTVPAHNGESPKASPLARRLAAERGVDLAAVRGTGPGGRIVERDVLAYAEGSPEGGAQAERGAAGGAAASPADYDDVELPRMRQAIALSVAHSMQVAPHFYVTVEIDMGRALDLRAQLREAYGDAEGRVTINDLVVKAAALALRRHPDLNAQFIEPKTMRRFRRIHVGMMVAVSDGLVAPVVRDADRLPIRDLARQARRLIEAAHQHRLRYEDYTGATFSVSNLGAHPVTAFSAIINAPQAGILAVGRVDERPAVRDGRVVARPMMGATISADHRVTDGVGAAALVAEVKRLLENPLLLLAG
jgi:pyruvate dehydrogenase E2 component (dihydrolipoamide acetyltransferase)